jgi:hypothetical protein
MIGGFALQENLTNVYVTAEKRYITNAEPVGKVYSSTAGSCVAMAASAAVTSLDN